MELPVTYYDPTEYFDTTTGNKISRRSLVRGSQNIVLNGKCIIFPGAVVRGELASVKMGKYTIIKEDVILRPTYRRYKGQLKYFTLHIGEHVFIDQNSIICASKIGNNVHIGKNCIISHRCVLHDNCRILDDSILSMDSEVPPFTVYGGKPALYEADLPESTPFVMKELTTEYYSKFVPRRPDS